MPETAITTPAPTPTSISIPHNGATLSQPLQLAPFGTPYNYTGSIVLAPGPGLPLGLSAAAACGCCNGESRLMLGFVDGQPLNARIADGSWVRAIEGSITLAVTGDAYYKVAFIPGDASPSKTCCDCLNYAYELKIPADTKAKTIGELLATVKPRGTTANDMKKMRDYIADLEAKVTRCKALLGEENAPDTPEEMKEILARIRGNTTCTNC